MGQMFDGEVVGSQEEGGSYQHFDNDFCRGWPEEEIQPTTWDVLFGFFAQIDSETCKVETCPSSTDLCEVWTREGSYAMWNQSHYFNHGSGQLMESKWYAVDRMTAAGHITITYTKWDTATPVELDIPGIEANFTCSSPPPQLVV